MFGVVLSAQAGRAISIARVLWYTQALEVSRERSDARVAAIPLNLGVVAYAQQDVEAARAFFEESLTRYRMLGEQGGLAACLDGFAGVYTACGETERAAQLLLDAADALRTAINEPVQPTDRADYERFLTAARSCLGEASFAPNWAEDARLTIEGGDRAGTRQGQTAPTLTPRPSRPPCAQAARSGGTSEATRSS